MRGANRILPAFVFALAPILLARCEERERDPNMCLGMPTKCIEALCSRIYGTSTTTIVDMNNGTIRITTSTPSGTTCAPYTATTIVYYKKCLQGQVYQSGSNDCRGAGNVGNNWNAQT